MAETWSQFSSIPNGTRIFNHGADECVALANRYHEQVIGGAFIGVTAAHQWWTREWAEINRLYTKSLFPVVGAIFISQGGIYDRTFGHIGVVTGVNANGSFTTLEQNAGSGPARWAYRYTRANDDSIWGFLIPRKSPVNSELEPHQRLAHAEGAIRREKPSSQSKNLGDPIIGGTVGNFDGWVYGESVQGISVWFRGISGAWFWGGAFTSQSTAGLKDLNPPKPPAVRPEQRKVETIPVRVRDRASADSKLTGSLEANAVITPEGWVNGQKVSRDGAGQIGIWYKVQGGYAWAGGFTSWGTGSLKDLNPKEEKPVDPPKPVEPPKKDFGSPGAVLGTIDRWSEEAPAWGSTNFERPTPASVNLEFPQTISERTARPPKGFYPGREAGINHLVLHHAASPHLQGTVDSLMGQRDNSANWVIKDRELVGMVDERDTPATNTRWRSNQFSVTFEVCNDKTTTDKPSQESHETAAWAVARTALRWGLLTPLEHGVNVFGHKEVSKFGTACPGDLDIALIVRRANEIIAKAETPDDTLGENTEALKGLTAILSALLDFLKGIFKAGGK